MNTTVLFQADKVTSTELSLILVFSHGNITLLHLKYIWNLTEEKGLYFKL